MNKEIDSKDREILEYITHSMNVKGFSPSMREIGKAVDLKSSSSIYRRLKVLSEKGYIEYDKTKPRTIALLPDNINISNMDDIEPVTKTMKVPLLGTVAAGLPILSEENLEEYINVPYSEALADKPLFFLKVRGESMINIGIIPGDKLLIEKAETADNGDIVVAYVEDRREEGVTVKKFYKENGHFRLQPENDNMEPIIANNVIIIGKVRALMRTMG